MPMDNNNKIETYTTQESIDQTLRELKAKADLIGKNPLLVDDYQELLKIIANIEEKVKAGNN